MLAATTSTVFAPSSVQLRRLYGAPFSEHRNGEGVVDSETFTDIQQGVSLTAQYGPDGLACRLEALPELVVADLIPRLSLGDNIVSEVLRELAPVESRGQEVGEGRKNSALYTEYENVLVVQRQGMWGVSDIIIYLKRESCPKAENPFSFLPPPDPETILRLTPSAAELRKRFGLVDSGTQISDIFSALSGVRVTVKYGSDHRACNIDIVPTDKSNPYIPKERVSELIDELAPAAMRGRDPSAMSGRGTSGYGEVRSSACGGVQMAIYENVFILRWPNYCVREHPDTDKQAIIQFTRGLCPNPYVKTETKQDSSR